MITSAVNDDTGLVIPPNSQPIPGPVSISGNLNTTGDLAVGGNETVAGTLAVTGATTLAATTLASASVTGNTTLGGTLAVTGAITPSPTAGIIGTNAANNANAGSVGELLTASVASPGVTLSNGVQANVITLSLTAGDWECSGVVAFKFAATTSYTLLAFSISTTSATLDQTIGQMGVFTTSAIVPGTPFLDMMWPVPRVRVSVAATTTIYLVADAAFTVAGLSAYGSIRARRVR